MLRLFFISLIIYVSLLKNAYAYIDPGMGSMILQALIGGIAAALTTIAIFWAKLKSLFSKIFNKKKTSSKDENKLE